ncbi:hypothetical protein GCM10023093_01170 [Nemorincola caseinilytica]|uniref:Uncharacterized protein n=1 Tax=Nemorincola caseinilytica TaxID=2054315 RepID=A0ABP8N1I0_9BACT
MTKIFVPVFAAALLTIGTLNAQTPKGKPAPAVKKETAPVNKVPVPVARPVVPVTKPAPSVVKPAVPVAKPAVAAPAPAPKPVPVPAAKPVATPKPVPVPAVKPVPVPAKPVAAKPAAPAKKAPATISKAPVKKAAVAKKAATKKPKASPVTEDEIMPSRVAPRSRYSDDEPVRRVEEKRIVIREEMESDNEHEEKPCCAKKASCKSYTDGCAQECCRGRYSKRRYDKYNYLMNYYKEKNDEFRKAHSKGECGHH